MVLTIFAFYTLVLVSDLILLIDFFYFKNCTLKILMEPDVFLL